MNRRDFIRGVTAALGAACFTHASAAHAKPIPIIDVHCHTLVLGDVPVGGLVRRYAPGLPEWVARTILRILGVDKATPEGPVLAACKKEGESREDEISEVSILRAVRWVRLMMEDHEVVLARLLEEYPQVGVFTPMMVDLDGWVGNRAESCTKHQIMAYESSVKNHVRRIRDLKKYRAVHPIVSFNPLKAATCSSYMPLIEDAILNRGFVGVKVYPSAGFRPSSNTDEELQQLLSPRYQKVTAAQVDRALHDLFLSSLSIPAAGRVPEPPLADFGGPSRDFSSGLR